MNRAERSVERMLAMQHQPTREIALDYVGMAVADVLAPGDIQTRSRHQGEIHRGLQAPEVEPRMIARAGRERTVETVANPQLITGGAAERADIRRDALFDLSALLRDAILVAAESAAEGGRLELSGSLQREESGVGVLEPLRMRMRCDCDSAGREAKHQRDGDTPAGNSILHDRHF